MSSKKTAIIVKRSPIVVVIDDSGLNSSHSSELTAFAYCNRSGYKVVNSTSLVGQKLLQGYNDHMARMAQLSRVKR